MEMTPDLSLSPVAGFEKDPAVSTLSPEDGFGLPVLSPEVGFEQDIALSSLSPEDGFGLSSLLSESKPGVYSTLSPEDGFGLPVSSPEERFGTPNIPSLAELAGEAPEAETKFDRQAAAQQIKAEKETYKAAIFQFVQGEMTQESISANLDRLVGAFESGNLYDKWRAVDFFDGIRAAIQKRIDGKLADASEMENFTRLLDTMGFSPGLVEVMRQETMLTATDKELYVKLASQIGDAKVKDKCLEIINKDERTPIEWWLLSLLSTRQIGEKAQTPAEAAKMANDMNLPADIEISNLPLVLNNATVEKVWQMLKNENPALYEKLITLLAKQKSEELTSDDKEIVRGVLSGKLGEKAIDPVFGALIQPHHMKFYIEERYLSGVGLTIENADKDVIIRLAARHFAAMPLSAAERQTLRFLERKYDNLGQNLKIDFIHGQKVDFEKMDNNQKINYLFSSIEAVTQSVDMHPTDEAVQTLADLTVMAERIAILLSLQADGKTTDPVKYEDLIKKISLPRFISQRQAILFDAPVAVRNNLERLRQLYLDEKQAFDQQVEDDLKAKSLNTILNEQLLKMADELPDLQAEAVEQEVARVEQKVPQIEIQTSTLASENHPDTNEDAMFQLPEKRAYGVFDGVGGHAAGNIASQMARAVAESAFRTLPDVITLEQAQKAVGDIIVDANRAVYAAAQTERNDMGTTASLAYIWEGPNGERKAIIGNVGDSRVYILRNGKLEQITLDDNMLRADVNFYDPNTHVFNEAKARLLQAKMNNVVNPETELNEEERSIYKKRNVISQGLGNKNIEPRIHTLDLHPGDRLLICSDGISDNLTDIEISNILAQNPNNADAMKKLTEAAQARSRDENHNRAKKDDMTGMIIAIPEIVVAPTGVEAMPAVGTAELVKQINDLAAKMTDEASYKANIKQYLEMAAKYEEQIPEGEEIKINDPALALSSPDAMTRYEQDRERFTQEAAQQIVQKEAALPTKERVEKGRGFGLKLLAGGAAVGLITIALLLGPLKPGKSSTQPAPTMPAPGAPAVTGPVISYPPYQSSETPGYVKPVTPKSAVSTPTPENPHEYFLTIGGTGEKSFATAGDMTHYVIETIMNKKYDPLSQWNSARSAGYWNALAVANGLPISKNQSTPWDIFNLLKAGQQLRIDGNVLAAAEKLAK